MAKYRSKKSACGLCKPHKKGWVDKHKVKDRASMDVAKHEIVTTMDEYFAMFVRGVKMGEKI